MTHVMRTLLAGVLFVSTACATLTAGSTQSISVSANVNGAQVLLDGAQVGTTPFAGVVKKNGRTLTIEMEGYQTETIELSKTLEPMFWGNIIIGGTVGSITDFATGAAYQYAPASYQVELRREGEDDTAYRHRLAVRKFSMIFLDEISRDLASGEGQYLSALVDLIEDRTSGAVEPSDVEQALLHTRGDPVRFGTRMVAMIQ